MSEENKRKLSEQLIKCVLDDKLSNDKKLRKMDYIIKLGADINVKHGTGYSLLSLAKLMGDDEVVSFLEKRGVEESTFDKKGAENFFNIASVEEINKFLKILPDGYELDCNVDLSHRRLTELPDFSKVVVNGYFVCDYNKLTSLEGVPIKVGRSFNCSNNQLTSLENAPSEVGGDFDCSSNQITSLKGAPIKVGKSFNCCDNQLDSLTGAPIKVNEDFNCNDNNLTSLVGGPREVGWNFDCSRNMLTNLKGVPLMIKRGFYCSHNELTSLEGIQTEIIGNFDCGHNKLTSLKGAPIMVGRDFNFAFSSSGKV